MSRNEEEETNNNDHTPKRADLERLIDHIGNYPDGDSNSMTPILLRRLKEELQHVKFYEYVADCPGISSDSQTLQTVLRCINKKNNVKTDVGILGLDIDSHNKVEESSFCSSSTEEEDNSGDNLAKSVPHKSSKIRSRCWSGVKSIWEVWLVLLLVAMVGSFGIRDWYSSYSIPRMETVLRWSMDRAIKEYTYYDQMCGVKDIRTSATLEDLTVSHADDAVRIQREYGLSHYSKVLSDDTSRQMREFVLHKNANLSEEEAIWLISQENRWSFYIDVDDQLNDNDPIVSTVLQELADHPVLAPSLQNILNGEEAAIVELTAITSAYGAGDQHWHTDTGPSDIHYSNVFSPMYSLFIPLQDTNAQMGPTDVCPGTHVCSDETTRVSENMFPDLCEQFGMRVSPMEQGDVMLLHLHTWHRGPAHNDPTPGSERVMLIFSVTPKPKSTHQISLGTSYSLKWDQYGYFLSDFQSQNQRQARHWFFKMLQAFGLINSNKNGNYGWSYLTVMGSRIVHEQFGFRYSDLISWIEYVHKHKEDKWMLYYVAGFLPRDGEEEWTAYLYRVLDIVSSTALMIYASVFLFTTFIAYFFQINKTKQALIYRPILHLSIYLILFYPFQYYMKQQVNNLPSVKEQYTNWSNLHPLQSKELLHTASTTTENNPVDSYSFKTKMPSRNSILVPSRTDVLDFHQGNRELFQQLEEQDHYYNFEPWFQHVVQEKQKAQNNGAFLHQNIDTGDWHVMTERNALEYVQWQWMQIHKYLPKTSPKTRGIASARHSQLFIKDLVHHLFQSSSVKNFPIEKKSQWKHRQPQSILTTLPSALLRKSFSLRSSSLIFLPSMEIETSMHYIGDFIESFVEGDKGWFRGQITGFSYSEQQELQIEVMFDDGVFVDDNFEEDIRPFLPYVEGESVWIDLSEEDEKIALGVITQVKANMRFNIVDANDSDTIYEDFHIADIRRVN